MLLMRRVGTMRYKLTAAFSGDIFLSPSGTRRVILQRHDTRFEILTDDKNRVVNVAVSRSVPANKVEQFKSSITPARPGVEAQLTVGGDNELREQLLAELQSFESNLAYSLNGEVVPEVDWRRIKDEFLPESMREEQLIAVQSLTVTRDWPKPEVELDACSFQKLIDMAPRYESLVTLKAFWRRGMADIKNFEFLNAFYNFYFIIEDCFADGKTGERAVLREFGDSGEFKSIVESTHQVFLQSKRSKHLLNLKSLMIKDGCNWTPPDIPRFLFRIRGNLHHYFSKNPRNQISPFTQEQHHSVALLASYVASLTIGYRVVRINEAADQRRDVAPTRS